MPIYSYIKSRDSSVGIANEYRLDYTVSNPGGDWDFFSSLPCPERLWAPPSKQWVPGALSLGLKKPESEAAI
jgi:hypothetical protein